MNEKKNDAERQLEEVKKESSGNKLLLIGILAGIVVLNTIVAFMVVKISRPKSVDEKTALFLADSTKKAQELLTSMGATTADNPIEAIVNIAGTDGERFLKAAVIFEYDEKAYPDLGAELLRRTPKFKDLLIAHLSKLTLMDVTEPEAKEKIRKDFVRLVNKSLPPKVGEVREVLFTTYIIQ